MSQKKRKLMVDRASLKAIARWKLMGNKLSGNGKKK
jgi:hypothetical protein